MITERIKTVFRVISAKRRSSRLFGKVFFINGNPVLPAPLTPQQEAECFDEIASGNENAREKLIVHNLRLVVYIAKKFDNSGVAADDLVSLGTIGLIKAVRTFSPEKNIKLATYASRCIENEILMYLRKTANLRTEISLDEPLNTDWDGNELLLSDVLFEDDDIVTAGIESEDEIRMLKKSILSLDERDRKILYLRYGFGNSDEYTQKEVADMLGISQSYISRIEKKIIRKLRSEIEKMTAGTI